MGDAAPGMASTQPADWVPAAASRSGSLLLAIGLVIGVETLALHVWLQRHHPYLAWTLTGLSLLTLGWLVRDYRALAVAGMSLGREGCRIEIGRRVRAEVPWSAVEQVRLPSWRDLPAAGRDYLNASRPDDPNLIFTFRAPLAVTGLLGRRMVRHLGLRLEPPGRVLDAWRAWGRAAAAD
jgi:hypothetical protein